MYTAVGSYYYIICTNCCIHTVVPPDDGHSYTRNMHRLTKLTKNNLCFKLVLLYTKICIFRLLSCSSLYFNTEFITKCQTTSVLI
jgi:hypothetical protein